MKSILITVTPIAILLSIASYVSNDKAQAHCGNRQKAMEIFRLLKQEVDMSPLKQFSSVKFKELLEWMESKSPEIKGKIRFDKNAYAMKIRRRLLDSNVSLLDFPDRMEIGDVLRLALFTGSSKNATFIIRDDGIEITQRFKQLEIPPLRVYPNGLNVPARPESFHQARLRELREFAKNLLSP